MATRGGSRNAGRLKCGRLAPVAEVVDTDPLTGAAGEQVSSPVLELQQCAATVRAPAAGLAVATARFWRSPSATLRERTRTVSTRWSRSTPRHAVPNAS